MVTRNEPHFEGHFPGHPVMPGVLIIEALAQAGALYAARLVKFDPGQAGDLLHGHRQGEVPQAGGARAISSGSRWCRCARAARSGRCAARPRSATTWSPRPSSWRASSPSRPSRHASEPAPAAALMRRRPTATPASVVGRSRPLAVVARGRGAAARPRLPPRQAAAAGRRRGRGRGDHARRRRPSPACPRPTRSSPTARSRTRRRSTSGSAHALVVNGSITAGADPSGKGKDVDLYRLIVPEEAPPPRATWLPATARRPCPAPARTLRGRRRGVG